MCSTDHRDARQYDRSRPGPEPHDACRSHAYLPHYRQNVGFAIVVPVSSYSQVDLLVEGIGFVVCSEFENGLCKVGPSTAT